MADDPFEGQRGNPLPPVEVDSEEEYQVSSVENCRKYHVSEPVTVFYPLDWV